MGTRKRAAVVLAVAGALGVGLIAYPANAAADPPPCTAGTSTTDNKSCVNFQVLPSNPGGTFTNSSLFFHTHTNFAQPGNTGQGGRVKTLRLHFDTDFRINPGTIPTCQGSDVAGKNIASAFAACGPAGKNAYLSPPAAVSGTVSTIPPGNVPGCSLVFHGPTTNQVLLYWRISTAPDATNTCFDDNPATSTFGNITYVFPGTIADSPQAGFGKRLIVPNLDLVNIPLDDFTAKLKRGNYIQAKCTVSPWKVLGSFSYSGDPATNGQPIDLWTATQPCS